MQHEIIGSSELDDHLTQVWDALLDESADYSSPFFSHGFVSAVGRHRNDLRIAVLRSDGKITGFLPFHLTHGKCAAPVGGQISDYQGVIGAVTDTGSRGEKLMRNCGLSAYDFNHGLASHPMLSANAFSFSESRRADLRDGFERWKSDVSAQSKQLKALTRNKRKIEGELGPLRLVLNDTSEKAWQKFVSWKDKSLRDQGAAGFPGRHWLGDLLQDIRGVDGPRFSGRFSTLYAGDRLVAAHFGMVSHRAWNWWFPTYDPSFSQFSTGLLLLYHCVEEAARMGLDELDFGRGSQLYKMQFGTRSRQLCEGSLERPLSPFGVARAVRKSTQLLANRTMSDQTSSIIRRAGTKILRAGII